MERTPAAHTELVVVGVSQHAMQKSKHPFPCWGGPLVRRKHAFGQVSTFVVNAATTVAGGKLKLKPSLWGEGKCR